MSKQRTQGQPSARLAQTEELEGTVIRVRGSYRIQILENGQIVGEGSGHNLVTNNGFLDYLVKLLSAQAGSKQVTYLALGTGGAPIGTDTTLAGEVVKRASVTVTTSSTSKALTFTATFLSSASFVTSTQNISNMGLFHSSNASTLFAGGTFASSSVATNQDVNTTYTITFT